MTENLAPLSSSQQFNMLMHTSQPSTVTLTTELLHASLVAASTHCAKSNGVSNNNANNTTTTTHDVQNNVVSRPTKRSPSCILNPRMSNSTLATLEYSVHNCPRRMARDLATVFPGKDLSKLLVVPTIQKCIYEMVAWDAEIAKEKDDRLEDFIRWSKAIHRRLEQLGHWSDMTDPASGFPCYSERGRDVYPDVDGCQVLLKYDFQNAGCCKILLHPVWGSKIYPATFFTTAPADIFEAVVQQVEQEHRP
ncbi:hypothetical protein BGZ94_007357 [Podila epigama]|nr:hypothetical protein BGZ94_007357 [Podila epigama]